MIQGSLFTRDFLEEGIKETAVWRDFGDDALSAFAARLRDVFADFSVNGPVFEDDTEQDLIFKLILDTFPIVRGQDQAAFNGAYRAGDSETRVDA